MSIKVCSSDKQQELRFGSANQLLQQAAATAIGATAAVDARSGLVPVKTAKSAASDGGLLTFIAAVAPVALPVLLGVGAVALVVKLASGDEKKEGNK